MGMGTTVVEAVDARRAFAVLPDAIPVGLRSAIQPLLALDPDDRPKYVDRLFVVPDGRDGSADTGRISTGRIDRSGDSKQVTEKGSRVGLMAGAAGAAALLVAGGFYMGLPGNTTTEKNVNGATVVVDPTVPDRPTREEGTFVVVTPDATRRDPRPAESEPVVVEEEKPVVVAAKPLTPKPRRVTAGDRLKIIGLINNAKMALEENRLMSPANDNAYDRYRQVLELDPNEKRAKQGLREVAIRYVDLAGQAAAKGDLEQARSFVDRAKRADGSYPGIATLESRLSN